MNLVQYSVEPLLRVAQTFAVTPRVMAEVGRLLRDPSADLGDITPHLKRDTALAARLLRVANSAAFAQSGRVSSIDDAATLIGYNEIHRLIGAMAVDQFSQHAYPLYGVSGRGLRENALFVALLMEELAGPAQESPQAAYTIGLFRCFGKLALEKLAAESAPQPGFRAEDEDLLLWEKQTFGITSNEATAIILRHWQFPRAICEAIAEHFTAASRHHRLTHLLNLSAGLADHLGRGLPGERRYWIESEESYRNCGIDPTTCQIHFDRAAVAFERLNRAMA